MMRTMGVAVIAVGLVAGLAVAEPPKAKKAETKKEDPMMAAMAKYATPGPQHKALLGMVGTWDVAGKFFMPGQAKPMETKGTSVFTAGPGDLFVLEEDKSEFMGKPFWGHGIHGYDLTKNKWVGTWIDSMGSYIMNSEGTADASGKVITYAANDFDPMTGKAGTVKEVMKTESDTRHVMEMYKTGPDGKEFKMMEMVYTKRK
jgi:Protein of unknown function (DUF1579)